jgi:hypothetical protein
MGRGDKFTAEERKLARSLYDAVKHAASSDSMIEEWLDDIAVDEEIGIDADVNFFAAARYLLGIMNERT